MAQYGNYKGYQGASRLRDGKSRATHIVDERLKAIAERIDLRGTDVLDIGCNKGYITVQVALSYSARSAIGIDIDDDLLDHARSHLLFRYSRIYQNSNSIHSPTKSLSSQGPHLTSRDRINYFPVSSIQKHGRLPLPVKQRGEKREPRKDEDGRTNFPLNVCFKNEDWGAVTLEGTGSHNGGSYDVVLALSVIKWLHLEHCDDGLYRFFNKCYRALRPLGQFVIEVQPWESYNKAVRSNKASSWKQNLESLKVRPEDFGAILEGIGFQLVEKYTGLPREILIYRKANKTVE